MFLIIFSPQEKRLGDWVAGTLVIQEESAAYTNEIMVSEEAKTLANRLQQEAEIASLLPEDFAVIREYLKRRDTMILEARIETARHLAYQLREIIALEKVPPEVTPNLFLEAVYFAYQKQS